MCPLQAFDGPKGLPWHAKTVLLAACRMAAHRKAKSLMRPNEFYTPPHIIEIARACMGGIDLDPASCALANETVCATTFYSLKQDGLKQPWFGKIWLNPPYAKFGPAFVIKAVEEIKAGRVQQAIILLRSNHVTMDGSTTQCKWNTFSVCRAKE